MSQLRPLDPAFPIDRQLAIDATPVVLVNVFMFILDSISQLAWLHPWLLTHWWTSFADLLRDPIATESIERGLITALVYASVFWLAAWARLSTKDISS